MSEHYALDVLIIGAGMAGLTAAHALADRGLSVRLLEQADMAGGRLATRAVGPGRADEGCQFFTVRDPRFGAQVQGWLDAGLVYEWSRGWNDGSLATTRDGHPRYAVRQGFRALADHLARGLDVRLNAGLAALRAEGDEWVAQDASGRTHRAKAVLMTPPAPVALALLDAQAVTLDEADRAALEQITYNPCLSALFWVENDDGLQAPGAVQRPEANLRWLADNRRKGISPDAVVLTAQAGAQYSRKLAALSDAQALSALKVDILPFLRDDARVVQSQLRRWDYSLATSVHPERFLIAASGPTLAFAGDGFAEPWLEGAALSGLLVAEALAGRLA